MFFDDDNYWYLVALVAILCGMVCVVVLGLIDFNKDTTMAYDEAREERNTEKVELYSIETTAETSGLFTLGCGKINDTDYYWCYREVEDGGKQRYKFEVDKTTVYETLQRGDQPYVEVITDGFKQLVEYKLYVPENTIMQTTDLSAPK